MDKHFLWGPLLMSRRLLVLTPRGVFITKVGTGGWMYNENNFTIWMCMNSLRICFCIKYTVAHFVSDIKYSLWRCGRCSLKPQIAACIISNDIRNKRGSFMLRLWPRVHQGQGTRTWPDPPDLLSVLGVVIFRPVTTSLLVEVNQCGGDVDVQNFRGWNKMIKLLRKAYTCCLFSYSCILTFMGSWLWSLN